MAKLFLVRHPDPPILVRKWRDMTIGRSDKSTIALSEPRVSRDHARVLWSKQLKAYAVTDLGSSNGTYLNGRKLAPNQPARLDDWDKIRIATTVYTVRIVNDPAVIETEFQELTTKARLEPTLIVNRKELERMGEEPALSGELQHLCPVEIFQLLESGAKTGVLTIQAETAHGTFLVDAGQVVAAEYGGKRGAPAVYAVLTVNGGYFSFMPRGLPDHGREIEQPTTFLLMEGCRLLDEATVQGPAFDPLATSA